MNGFCLKSIIALMFIVLSVILIQSYKIPWKNIFFSLGFILLICFYFFSNIQYESFESLNLDFTGCIGNDFIGTEIAPTDNDRRFFGKSTIHRGVYVDTENRNINFLCVSNFDDVHKIHPAGHCLRTAGRNIIEDHFIFIDLEGRQVQVNEIILQNGEHSQMIVWSWYSNHEFSSGNFLFFRHQYEPHQNWKAYQIAISCYDKDLSIARTTLQHFMNVFLIKNM